jgi:hypothetical protein
VVDIKEPFVPYFSTFKLYIPLWLYAAFESYLQSSLFICLDGLDDIEFDPPINFDEYIIVLCRIGDLLIDALNTIDEAVILNPIFQ